ncbi:hypothetical protein [Sagittula salina]|uniref:Uncharacterized protein n=1 Tax=Sagittula salina TaxID=2820268 RepID=A0A940S368_9RHOB|nr:hypothetical protein [Sagittula salina]MBP0482435.1 hypothetical protein [Sagittula salina]
MATDAAITLALMITLLLFAMQPLKRIVGRFITARMADHNAERGFDRARIAVSGFVAAGVCGAVLILGPHTVGPTVIMAMH